MLNIWQILVLFGILSVGLNVHAEESIAPAFSDPLTYQKVESNWFSKPIRYADGVDADIVISTDQNLYALLEPLVQTYANEHHLKIAVQSGTCGISAGKLSKKKIDIGGYCCPPGESDRLPGLVWHTLGVLPIEIIVNPSNPVNNLTLQQVRAIFSGELDNWKELYGERNQFIHPVARLHCKLRPGHWRLLLDNEDEFSPETLEVAAIEDMIRTVGMDSAAIGYEVATMIEFYKKAGQIKKVTVNGTSPDKVIDGKYPFYRVYNLTTWSDTYLENDKATALVRYLTAQLNSGEPGSKFISAKALKQHGWKFFGDELIGSPDSQVQ